MRIIFLIIICFLFSVIFGTSVLADNIDSTYKYSWAENIGWLNWAPIYNSTEYGVTVYDECLTGYIWAENGGWIKTGDISCAGSDCCQTGASYGYENDSNSTDDDGDGVNDDWGVNNNEDGILSGYAWGENIGWLNFNTAYSTTTIDSQGYFLNYAWGENVGWLNMNCSNDISCGSVDFKVKTSWLPNALPAASNASIDSGAGSITLNEGATTDVVCAASLTDINGYADIESVVMKLYRSGVGEGVSDDNDNHYTLTWPSACARSNESGNMADFTCTFSVYFYAEPTDAGTYAAENWVCRMLPSDGQGAGTADTDTIEMDTLTALDVSASINYGSLSPNSNSTGTRTATITNTGNRAIDFSVSGSALNCDIRGSILVGNQEYSLSAFSYGVGIDLTSSLVDVNASLPKPDSDNSTIFDLLYWQVGAPGGIEGACIGVTTFTAITEI